MLPFLAGSEPRALAPCHAGYVPPEGYAGGGMDTSGDTGSESIYGASNNVTLFRSLGIDGIHGSANH